MTATPLHRRLVGALLAPAIALAVAGCGGSFDVNHDQPSCVHPGDRLPLTITAPAGTRLHFQIQDDFGGDLSPALADATVPSSGSTTVTWTVPGGLSTSTLHILTTATNDSGNVVRDIHVRLRQPGDAC